MATALMAHSPQEDRMAKKSKKIATREAAADVWRHGGAHDAARAVPVVPRRIRCVSRTRRPRRRERRSTCKKAKIVTIKTVVNVVYKTAEQNVSTAQINSQIKALNKDFRATNPDKSQTPAPWTGLVTDSRIQFKLVKVTRTKTTEDDFTHDDGVKSRATGGIAPFSPKTHLNLWVCPLRDSLLGYAQFPGGPQSTDGVVINYLAFGTTGTAQRRSTRAAPRRTRSATTSTCGTSGVTRPIAAARTWCPTRRTAPVRTRACRPFPTITCNNGPNGDMFVNYMDYTDDPACSCSRRSRCCACGPRSKLNAAA